MARSATSTYRSSLAVAFTLCLVLTLSACGGAATNDGATTTAGAEETTTTAEVALEPLTIQFTWLPGEDNEGVSLAAERGYFEEEGLDVTISPGGGAVGAPQQLAAGNADIAVGGVDDVPNAIGEGIPLVSLAVMERYVPAAVFVRADSDIQDPAELAGETVTIMNFDAGGVMLPAYLEAVGVDPDSVATNNVDSQVLVSLFVSGDTDIGVGFTRSTGVQLAAEGVDVRAFHYTDEGVFFPATGIFATRDILSERPEAVRGAVRAILRGYADAVNNPEAAAAAAAERFPENYENMAVKEASSRAFAESVRAFVPEEGLGFQLEEDWASGIELLQQYFGLEDALSPSEYFTNDFLPAEPIFLD